MPTSTITENIKLSKQATKILIDDLNNDDINSFCQVKSCSFEEKARQQKEIDEFLKSLSH
jgi:hypothetical protein